MELNAVSMSCHWNVLCLRFLCSSSNWLFTFFYFFKWKFEKKIKHKTKRNSIRLGNYISLLIDAFCRVPCLLNANGGASPIDKISLFWIQLNWMFEFFWTTINNSPFFHSTYWLASASNWPRSPVCRLAFPLTLAFRFDELTRPNAVIEHLRQGIHFTVIAY